MNAEPGTANSPDRKIYKDKAITAGTYLGGPLVAGYFLAENFKAFGEPGKAKKIWLYAILFTIALFGILIFIPDVEKVPRYLIPFTYTGIVYLIINTLQVANINSHIAANGQIYSWWRTIAISLIGLIITFVPFVAIFYFYDNSANTAMTSKSYGTLKHEISYMPGNLSVPETDKLAEALTATAFFDNAQQKFVFVKKSNSAYEIHISVDPAYVNNSETSQTFKDFRSQLQTFFPAHKIVIVLITDAIDHVIRRIE